MFDVLQTWLSQKMNFTENELDFLLSYFTPRYLDKNECVLREGEVPRFGIFVCQGCLRSYVVDDKGREHIIQFAPQNWWLSDMENMIHQKPTVYFMDAIEDSEVLLIDMPGFETIMKEVPAFTTLFRQGYQKHAAKKDERIIASLTLDAEERYKQFLHSYPSIVQKVPQHMLASYLGISPETLSRIRKKWSLTNLVMAS